ncbi:hypothetical protein D3C87_1155310 [compost metagenome]
MVVLLTMTAPASFRRAAGGASAAAGMRSTAAVPAGSGSPRVAMFSLIVVGTPSSGPRASPRCQRCSEARACSSAASGRNSHVACSRGSQCSMRAMTARVTSTGDRRFSR